MRVAMVSEHASPLAVLGGVDAGGQNVHVAALALALARRGIEVTVYTRRDDPDLPRRVALGPRVTVEHVPAGPAEAVPKDDLLPYMGEFAEYLSGRWRRQRPAVVHAHFWMSALASLDAAQPLGIPVATTFHALGSEKRRQQGDKDTSPPERIEIEERIARESDLVLATASHEVFEIVRMGGDLRRTVVVPCGVDLALFRPDGVADARCRDRARIVVVSRLVERKGIGNVVAAVASLPGVELVIAGGPDRHLLMRDREARRLAGLAHRLGVEDRVVFLGRLDRERVPALMRSADVVVCAPWYEPFGMVAVEAMACGVPVVTSAVGGLVDSVVDGVTGIHVPPRDPERLAGAIGRLLADESLRRQLGRAGVRRARRLYGWDRVAASTVQAYATVMTERTQREEARA